MYYRIQRSDRPELPMTSTSWDAEDSRPGVSVCTSWTALVRYFSNRSTIEHLRDADIVVCEGERIGFDMDERGELARDVALLDPTTVTMCRRRRLSRHEIKALLGNGGRADRFWYNPAKGLV